MSYTQRHITVIIDDTTIGWRVELKSDYVHSTEIAYMSGLIVMMAKKLSEKKIAGEAP